jgi:hypothetical protein
MRHGGFERKISVLLFCYSNNQIQTQFLEKNLIKCLSASKENISKNIYKSPKTASYMSHYSKNMKMSLFVKRIFLVTFSLKDTFSFQNSRAVVNVHKKVT